MGYASWLSVSMWELNSVFKIAFQIQVEYQNWNYKSVVN